MSSQYLLRAPSIEMLERRGYLIIDVTDDLLSCVNSIFVLGRAFFRRSKAAKRTASIPHLNEGWKELGAEYSVVPERPDLHESFWVTQRQCEQCAAQYSADGLGLHREMFRCISMLNNIERVITAALLKYLCVDADSGTTFCCDRDSDMQILYYQPAVHTRELLQDPHDDSLYLTFSKADNPGLEILVSGGDYQPVILGRREMIVMPGEILSLMSGYRIAPLIHKVVRHSEQSERMTLGYFTLPNLEMGRQLRPWIVNESNKDVDIMQRVMRNQNKFIVQ